MIRSILHWLQHRQKQAQQNHLLTGDGPALKSLLFHGIHESTRAPSGVDPTLSASLDWVEQCLRETQRQGFTFISAADLPRALSSKERLAMLTLDDGYANNRLLLPLLHRLHIPALLFVTTDTLLRQRCYWWDVLAREAAGDPQLSEKRRALKKLKPAEIEHELTQRYGDACFQPQGDHDRPLIADELREFARDPLITIGNHTHRHALLDQLSESEVREELQLCQQHLTDLLGEAPTTLAYPNGRWNSVAADEAAKIGLQYAFTTEQLISPLPLAGFTPRSLPRLQPMPS